jgi:hypothetical protein
MICINSVGTIGDKTRTAIFRFLYFYDCFRFDFGSLNNECTNREIDALKPPSRYFARSTTNSYKK